MGWWPRIIDKLSISARFCRLGDAVELGKVVRAYRKKLKMSQEELAALSGISERTLRDLEKGRLSVSLEKAVAVTDVLGLKIQVIEA